MNIGILSKGTDYSDLIGKKASTSCYLLVFNCETFQYNVLNNPLVISDKMCSRIEFILLLINSQVSSLLVQTCSVDLKKMLEDIGISIIESSTGAIGDVVEQLKKLSLEETHIIPIENIISDNPVQSSSKTPA